MCSFGLDFHTNKNEESEEENDIFLSLSFVNVVLGELWPQGNRSCHREG